MNKNEITSSLNAIRNGDKTAFEELYKDLQTPIFTVIYRITWDKSVSEEILQDVFFKLFLSPPGPHIKNPRAYIFQMARNLAIDSVRKQSPHLSLDEISETAHQPLDDFALRLDINDALKSLPAQECEIVTLHIIGGLKFREIASVMNIPSGTAKWKYQKAIGTLQKTIRGGLL
uniref:RNA polymerase sigma factor n=1 Tax=uncultured bacterium contig00017 TaxID=1181508 RepID=A0A806JXY3_9BACT|nr:RNA polymerase sigma factor [uncultured bacterium contig00017]